MTIACLEDDEVEGIRNKGLDRRAERVSRCSYRNRNGGCRSPIQCIRMDVNSTPFVALLSFSLNVTCLNFFAVSHFNCCPYALRFSMSERHWKLINIVFIVAKLGNTCFGRKICIRKQKCFWLQAKTFFVSELQNCFRNMFPARLNWETFASATMFLARPLGPGQTPYWFELKAVST